MGIKSYIKNEQRYFEVYVAGMTSAGRRVQKTKSAIDSLRAAQKVEFEFKRELALLKEEAVPIRWGEWFEESVKRMRLSLMPSTISGYETQIRWRVNPHWANTEMRDIKKADVHDLIYNKCERIKTERSRRNILKMIKRVFQMAVEEGHLDKNPCNGVNIRVAEVVQKVLTNTEVETFLREAKLMNHRFYPVWVMALMTGMRSGELFALKWTDIDFDGRRIAVTKAWNSKNGISPTKSKRSRVVPISDDLLSFLKERKLQHGVEDDHVLPRLKEWDHGEQAKITRGFCKGLGITPIKFHDLRATFITNLLTRGEALARVMCIVGHSDLKTTNCYLRKAGVDVQGGTDKLSYKVPQLSGAEIISLTGSMKL